MAPLEGELCVVGVSRLASIPGYLDVYFGFVRYIYISSPLSVFVLGLYIHFLYVYCLVSRYLLLTKPDLRCLYFLLLLTEVVQ
jgi:hypothetical protein